MLDLQNSSNRKLHAIVEKYACVLETSQQPSLEDYKSTLAQRLVVSHQGRQLLEQAKVHVEKMKDELETEDLVTTVKGLVHDFVRDFEYTPELDSLEDSWSALTKSKKSVCTF